MVLKAKTSAKPGPFELLDTEVRLRTNDVSWHELRGGNGCSSKERPGDDDKKSWMFTNKNHIKP
jgi:hypothetical protein